MRKSLTFHVRFHLLIAVCSVLAVPIFQNADASDLRDCTKEKLVSIVNRLMALSVPSADESHTMEYTMLKKHILDPEMRCQINLLEANSCVLQAYVEYSEERKLDIPGTYRAANNVPRDRILLTPSFQDSTLSVIDTKYLRNKAEVIMQRKVIGDLDGKVWLSYEEEIRIFFECCDGKWIIQDVSFTNTAQPLKSYTLREYLSSKIKADNFLREEWRPLIESALSKAESEDTR